MSNVEPKSPLTIIAIFAGIIEASALASLPFLGEDSQGIYTWFLVGFPPFLTILFFLTLNFNSKTLYCPEYNEDTPEVTDESKDWPTSEQRESHLPPARSAFAQLTTQAPPLGCDAMAPAISTIVISGAHSTSLIEYLVTQAITQQPRLGTLVIHNLETGTQTTLTTHALGAEPPQ